MHAEDKYHSCYDNSSEAQARWRRDKLSLLHPAGLNKRRRALAGALLESGEGGGRSRISGALHIKREGGGEGGEHFPERVEQVLGPSA